MKNCIQCDVMFTPTKNQLICSPECVLDRQKQRNIRNYAENKDKIIANVERHRKSPEYRKKQSVWNMKWRETNREKYLEIKRASEKKRNKQKRERGSYTNDEWIAIKDSQGNVCAMCGVCDSVDSLTVDHIMPLSRGGVNTKDNIQALCMSCNTKKATYHPDDLHKYL